MRITERRMLLQAATQVAKARERVSAASEPVSTGLEVSKPSDDPARWAAGRRAKLRLQVGELREQAIGSSNSRLSESERAFSTVGEVISRSRELAVLAANGAQNAESRLATSKEVAALFDEALVAANTRGSDGEYLLAGSRGENPPFDATGVYQGDTNARTIEAAEGSRLAVTVTGTLFTAASGVDIFDELTKFRDALVADDLAGIQNAIGGLEQAVHQVSLGRAEIGGLQSSLDSAESASVDFEIVLSEMHQRAVEIDPIKAASELALSTQALQTSQALTERIAQVVQAV
jgi:flagellar hook-associated protein 3 FlgL